MYYSKRDVKNSVYDDQDIFLMRNWFNDLWQMYDHKRMPERRVSKKRVDVFFDKCYTHGR